MTPEKSAAVVNGLLVLLVPVGFITAVVVLSDSSDLSGLRPAPPPVSGILTIIQSVLVMGPLALMAAWRTYVHATRRRDGQGRGGQGVLEAGACGLLVAIAYLLPGILTRPRDAPPYVIFYGTAGAIAGCIVGGFLWLTASAVLRLRRSAG